MASLEIVSLLFLFLSPLYHSSLLSLTSLNSLSPLSTLSHSSLSPFPLLSPLSSLSLLFITPLSPLSSLTSLLSHLSPLSPLSSLSLLSPPLSFTALSLSLIFCNDCHFKKWCDGQKKNVSDKLAAISVEKKEDFLQLLNSLAYSQKGGTFFLWFINFWWKTLNNKKNYVSYFIEKSFYHTRIEV